MSSFQEEKFRIKKQEILDTKRIWNIILDEIIEDFLQEDYQLEQNVSVISSIENGSESLMDLLPYTDNETVNVINYNLRPLKHFQTSQYLELGSDSDNDSIFSLPHIVFDLQANLEKCLEFDGNYGVKATHFIPVNTSLGYYTGKTIKNFQQVKKILCRHPPHYILESKKGKFWIDGHPKYKNSCILSFINHSCIDCNIMVLPITRSKILFKTCKDIYPNDFVHFNYQIRHIIKDKSQNFIPCKCHAKCKNVL